VGAAGRPANHRGLPVPAARRTSAEPTRDSFIRKIKIETDAIGTANGNSAGMRITREGGDARGVTLEESKMEGTVDSSTTNKATLWCEVHGLPSVDEGPHSSESS
jgi:hypothetical protein